MKLEILLLVFLWGCVYCNGQQVPDLDFEPQVTEPKYGSQHTALIGIDGGHNNLHQLEGGFAPFAKLMKADGYELTAVHKMDQEQLSQLNILAIVNPLHNSNIGNWKRPVAAAFNSEEIDRIERWVSEGGSLLLIADHMPYGGAANTLANAFGFSYEDGFAMTRQRIWPPDPYSKAAGNLLENILTAGIDSLAGFTGSALKAPKEATVIAHFPEKHQLLLPEVAWQFEKDTEVRSLDGYVMGAVKEHGKGKVALFTEAAMFTAQIVQEKHKVGFNSPRAPQNQQFVRNVVHWLDNGHTYVRAERKSEAEKIVENLLTKQGRFFEANQMEEVAACYTTDGVIYEPTSAELRGMEQIKAYWKQLEGNALKWQSHILEVETVGDQILAICRFEISFKRNGQTLTARSKALLTLKKEMGDYKIFRDFYTALSQ